MFKFVLLITIFFTFNTLVRADEISDLYFSLTPSAQLTKEDREALALAEKWARGDTKPTQAADGSVQFVFGASLPTIVCATLQITDIQLQANEHVNSIHLGDAVRWSVEPSITGTGPNETQHIVIKPKDSGLETSLMVATDKRTYHFYLKATQKTYMPKISFFYPDTIHEQWAVFKSRQSASRSSPSAGLFNDRDRGKGNNESGNNTTSVVNLSFDYEISGKAPWKPERVYNDGTHTIIQMPSDFKNSEAPALLVVREASMFSSNELVMVNYRVQNNKYIVDAVFDKAILIAGVGGQQNKVTITRNNGSLR
jgi:type IV secretion system protein VirB9